MQRTIPFFVLAVLAACGDDTSLSMGPQGGEVPPATVPGAAPAKGGPKAIPINGRIYFAANITGQFDLYSMKPDGTDRRRITFTVDADEWQPDVSPDGKKLAYLVKTAAGLDISVINTDGTGTRRLTFYNANPSELNSLRGPRWSPDGRKIAFSNTDPATQGSALYVMTPTGAQVTRISPAEAALRIDPEWSPDGTTIAFTEYVDPGFVVRTMPATGGAMTTLGDCGPGYCYRPSWSPDGTRLFIETGDLRVYQYVFAPLAHNGFVQAGLVDITGGSVAFAPDGSRFVYANVGQQVLMVDANDYAPANTVASGILTGGLAWGR